jgi:hypothetical protein
MQTLASQLSCINSCLTRGGCIKHNISFTLIYIAQTQQYTVFKCALQQWIGQLKYVELILKY